MGGNLSSLLQADGRLPEASVHHFGRALATALQFLHSKSILHCDLQPANILLDENGQVKLAGFGFARTLLESTTKDMVSYLLAGFVLANYTISMILTS